MTTGVFTQLMNASWKLFSRMFGGVMPSSITITELMP